MSRIIARSNPVVFKTQAIQVCASDDALSYLPVGSPMSFREMHAKRRPISIDDPWNFEVTVANLGVSVDICLQWQGRSFHLLVRQDRQDMGDNVLKLLSGYVPAHELRVPLLTVMTEIAEELLLEGSNGWLGGEYQGSWLPTPYSASLPLDPADAFSLKPVSGHTRPVFCGDLPLIERPRAYVHLPTNSLQLVYHLCLELPDHCEKLSALHADEALDAESGELIARMDEQEPDLYLAELRDGKPTQQLYTLRKGVLIRQPTEGLRLSEALAEQTGWIIDAGGSSWPEGLSRL
jgi:hypothetical protein